MLVLERRQGQSIFIGDNVRIVVTGQKGPFVSLGIDAPQSVQIVRGEIYGTSVNVKRREAPVAEDTSLFESIKEMQIGDGQISGLSPIEAFTLGAEFADVSARLQTHYEKFTRAIRFANLDRVKSVAEKNGWIVLVREIGPEWVEMTFDLYD